MTKPLLYMSLCCIVLTGCDPGARWQVYEPTRSTEQTQRIQVLTYTVGKEQATPSFRVIFPDGTQWQVEALLGDPSCWRMLGIDPDGYTTEIPMTKAAEGGSLGGATWWNVDRAAAETQAATTQFVRQVVDEQKALTIAKQAVETHDAWGDHATYEVRQTGYGWSVVVWHEPRTAGDFRLIAMDRAGKVLRYSREQKTGLP